jgi:hypothetical protein
MYSIQLNNSFLLNTIFRQKLNKCIPRQNWILFVIYNYMFRPISGNPQVNYWSLKHIEENICVHYVSPYNTHNIIKVINKF